MTGLDGPHEPFALFPAELQALRRFVTWRRDSRGNGKPTKRPDQSVADERTWITFSDARERVARGQALGIGFVLGNGVVGIDLDACISSNGTLHDVARDAIEMLGTYVEHSPSGRGLHVLIRAEIEKPRKIGKRGGVPGRELYDGRAGGARYFTVTGSPIGDVTRLAEGAQAQDALDTFVAKWFPAEPQLDTAADVGPASGQLEGDAILRVMFGAKDGAKWRALFEGDHSRYPSQSEADLALVGKLRFYTRADAAQIDRLFRRSGLMRPKWDERRGSDGETYGERTIAKVLAKGGPVYIPRSSDRTEKLAAHERTAWGRVELWATVRLKGAGELACRVLSVIASYADKSGIAYPTVETIALHCDADPRKVRAALKELREREILTSTLRYRQSNLYRLARRVPESGILHAVPKNARRVPESEHLGGPGPSTVTDQELTNVDTGGGR